MPANLTPQYLNAEKEYRNAPSPVSQLEALRRMLREIPKHKGTDRMQADLKSKIAKLKIVVDRIELTSGKGTSSTAIAKQGVGRIVMIGPPRSGKTQLLQSLTRANVSPGDAPFSTRSPQVGMMAWEDCPIQLIDLPSIGYPPGQDQIAQWVRSADLVWLVVNITSSEMIEQTQQAIDLFAAEKTRLGIETALEPSQIGVKSLATLIIATQCDRIEQPLDLVARLETLAEFLPMPLPVLAVSGTQGTNLESILGLSVNLMRIVRVYCKHPKEDGPDLQKPLFIQQGDSLKEVANQIHESVADHLIGAKIWKSGAWTFQMVKPDYQPRDGDIVELAVA